MSELTQYQIEVAYGHVEGRKKPTTKATINALNEKFSPIIRVEDHPANADKQSALILATANALKELASHVQTIESSTSAKAFILSPVPNFQTKIDNITQAHEQDKLAKNQAPKEPSLEELEAEYRSANRQINYLSLFAKAENLQSQNQLALINIVNRENEKLKKQHKKEIQLRSEIEEELSKLQFGSYLHTMPPASQNTQAEKPQTYSLPSGSLDEQIKAYTDLVQDLIEGHNDKYIEELQRLRKHIKAYSEESSKLSRDARNKIERYYTLINESRLSENAQTYLVLSERLEYMQDLQQELDIKTKRAEELKASIKIKKQHI